MGRCMRGDEDCRQQAAEWRSYVDNAELLPISTIAAFASRMSRFELLACLIDFGFRAATTITSCRSRYLLPGKSPQVI